MAEDTKEVATADKAATAKQSGKSGKGSGQASAKQAENSGKSGKKQQSKQSSSNKQTSKQAAKQDKKSQKKPNIFQRFVTYLRNVRIEIRRTSWPSRNEVWRMSLIVIGALLFFGVTIFGLDFLMGQLLGLYANVAPTGSDAMWNLFDQLDYVFDLVKSQ